MVFCLTILKRKLPYSFTLKNVAVYKHTNIICFDNVNSAIKR